MVAASATLLAFWIGAYFCAVVAIVARIGVDIDRPDGGSGGSVGAIAPVMAVGLYVASGPVSYLVGRRRLFLAAPLLFAVMAAVVLAVT